MWNIGDSCYIVVQSGEVAHVTIQEINGKTRCTVVNDDGERIKVSTKSIYDTQSRALDASHKSTKKTGPTEVQPFWNLEDIVHMANTFKSHGQYHHYLAFMFGILTGRRIGDVLALRWDNIYACNGRMKRDLEIQEQKTGKISSTCICGYLRKVIEEYVEKMGIDPSKENYTLPIFPSNGSRKDAAYRVAFKKAANECGITYPVSTHSTRKTFGYWSKMIHPNDVNSLDILQKIFQHSDRSITAAYIGLTKETADQYMNDMGKLINKAFDGENITIDHSPTTTLYNSDLREIISQAYYLGRETTSISDGKSDVNNINRLMQEIERKRIQSNTY